MNLYNSTNPKNVFNLKKNLQTYKIITGFIIVPTKNALTT